MVLVQQIGHKTSHGRAHSQLEDNRQAAHVQQLSLPVIVDASEEGLIDEEV